MFEIGILQKTLGLTNTQVMINTFLPRKFNVSWLVIQW